MTEISCDRLLMAKMAEIDGEEAEISAEQVNLHLKSCESCRSEIERMQEVDRALQTHIRYEDSVDLWSNIEKRIGAGRSRQIGWTPFVVVSTLLVAYKLIEMLPDRDPGLAIKLVPLIIAAVLFVVIRENPFKINSELILEK